MKEKGQSQETLGKPRCSGGAEKREVRERLLYRDRSSFLRLLLIDDD